MPLASRADRRFADPPARVRFNTVSGLRSDRSGSREFHCDNLSAASGSIWRPVAGDNSPSSNHPQEG